MKLRLIKYNEVPPGGYRYKDPETGVWIKGPDWNEFCRRVRGHRLANNLPIPVDLDERIEQQLCEILPADWCRGGAYYSAPITPLTLAQAIQGTATLADWGFHGANRVDQAESNRRARLCFYCHFNQSTSSCTNCARHDLREAAKKLIGNARTDHDASLHICSICGCALQVKVHVPLDILQRHFSKDQNQKLPDFCWVKKHDEPTNIPTAA